MDMEQFEANIDDYLHGELSDAEEREFEIQMLSSPECHKRVLKAKAIDLTLREHIATADAETLEKMFIPKPRFDFSAYWENLRAKAKEEVDKTAAAFKYAMYAPALEMHKPRGIRGVADDSPKIAIKPGVFPEGMHCIIDINPEDDRHVVLLDLDAEGNLALIHPNAKDRGTYVGSLVDTPIAVIVGEPIGRHTIKVIATQKDLFPAESIDFSDTEAVTSALSAYFEAVAILAPGEVAVCDIEYEVVDPL